MVEFAGEERARPCEARPCHALCRRIVGQDAIFVQRIPPRLAGAPYLGAPCTVSAYLVQVLSSV